MRPEMKKIRAVMYLSIIFVLVVPGYVLAGENKEISPEIAAQLQKLHAEIDAKGGTYRVGYNRAMEYSLDELCGHVPQPQEVFTKAVFDNQPASTSLPARWNWMEHNGVTAIKDQAGDSTCWAFATVAPFECNILIHDGTEVDLSEQYIISCADGIGWSAHEYHCDIPARDGLTGAVYEFDCPYVGYGIPCDRSSEGYPYPYPRPYELDSWAYIGSGEPLPPVEQIKQAIFDYGPVSVAVAADIHFKAYTGGIFNHDSGVSLNHAITLVGWDDTKGENGVWFLRNSWGDDWGEGGYMRIEYGRSLVGSAAAYVVYNGGVVSPDGMVSLNDDVYSCLTTVRISVRDSDLTGAGAQDVTIFSERSSSCMVCHYQGDHETVTLSELESTGRFLGRVTVSNGPVIPEDGILQVLSGETITAIYIDVDDGKGGHSIEKRYLAEVDCMPPYFSGLNTATAGPGYVSLTWDAAGDVHGPVNYSISRDQSTGGSIGTLIADTCSLAYRDYSVDAGNTYYYVVRAKDSVGNEEQNTIEKSAVPLPPLYIERISMNDQGEEGDDDSYKASINADGRYTAFESSALNLVAGDTNEAKDIFVYDREMRTIERVSIASDAAEANDYSCSAAISGDGRYIAFESSASNIVTDDTNGTKDIFVFDRNTRTTERVSITNQGAQGNGNSCKPGISANDRYVAFESAASNLVEGDTNGRKDIFVFDRNTRTIERVSINNDAIQGNRSSCNPGISGDGQYVVFESFASNLVPDDTNGIKDVFLFDRQSRVIKRVSIADNDIQADRYSSDPGISSDGRYITFESCATNLIPGDTNGVSDIFLFDRCNDSLERVSVADDGTQANDYSSTPSISEDGRYVAFKSAATNLVVGDSITLRDIFVFDRNTSTIERVNVTKDGIECDDHSGNPSISADGRYVAFDSLATNLVAGDTNEVNDVFMAGIPDQ